MLQKGFPLLFCLPTAPLGSAQLMCNSEAHYSSECQSWEKRSHFTTEHAGSEGTDALSVPVLFPGFSWERATIVPRSCTVAEGAPLGPCKLAEPEQMLKTGCETKQPARRWLQKHRPGLTGMTSGAQGSGMAGEGIPGAARKKTLEGKVTGRADYPTCFLNPFLLWSPRAWRCLPLLVDNLECLQTGKFSLRGPPEDGGVGVPGFQGKGWNQFSY